MLHPQTSILLVQPPYLRFLGSHNDRIPLELCYLNAHLHAAGFNSCVYNADWSGATTYLAWRKLFENSFYLQDAADGKSPLYNETLERIMSFNPKVVVLSAADNLTPWVDLGNAYTTAFLSEKLRTLGVYTVGVGSFYTEVPSKFISSFDAILTGTASPSIVDIVREMPRGQIIAGRPMNTTIQPLIDVLPAIGRDDVVMTAVGCPFTCTFCLARDSRYFPLAIEGVVADIVSRSAEYIDFGDAILPLQVARMRELTPHLAGVNKKYSCEVSVSSISERSLQALCELGVVAVKMGLESGDDSQLASMKKRQTAKSIMEAVRRIKSFDLHLTVYLILGGPSCSAAALERTYELCGQIEADDYVANIWSFHDLAKRDFRYDAHWSQFLVREWRLEDTISKFLDLQMQKNKHGLGPLI
jgi:hypothetical protein